MERKREQTLTLDVEEVGRLTPGEAAAWLESHLDRLDPATLPELAVWAEARARELEKGARRLSALAYALAARAASRHARRRMRELAGVLERADGSVPGGGEP